MNVGFIGLGKLGLPVALAIESKGYDVKGYDVNPNVAQYIHGHSIPFVEKDLQPLLDNTKIEILELDELVAWADILFCAVQTPHEQQFDGSVRIPEVRKDFDYQYLIAAVQNVADAAQKQQKQTKLVVISTCLPGTFNRDIKPILNEYVDYVYNPLFIAMGTVLDDFLYPEFVLLGSERPLKNDPIKWLYESVTNAPFVETDITSAEAVKVSYNTFITMKTVLGNAWGELCQKVGADFGALYKAWGLSTRRLISIKYLDAGVGDGGGCHPRDNIALSYIAKKVGMSHNIWEDLMAAREDHMAWLAKMAVDLSKSNGLPIIILGRSFKPETNIETGSPALLMARIIRDELQWPILSHVEDIEQFPKAVYVIGTKHNRYSGYNFPVGSVVLDPFRYIPKREGVQVVSVGGKM